MEQFVRPGQTITAKDYAVAAGGKGLNQSLAAARAGRRGATRRCDRRGRPLYARSAAGIGADTSLLREVDRPSGHTVIEINAAGQNRIIVFGGANPQHDERSISSGCSTSRAAGRLGAAAEWRSTSCRRSSAVRMKGTAGGVQSVSRAREYRKAAACARQPVYGE